MSRLTPDYLLKCTNRWNLKRGESVGDYLKRVTHLYLSEHRISSLDGIELCTHLTTLYLYDNSIRKIHNLAFARGLTHLYLQNNFISKLEGLSSLQSLTNLYLAGNQITVVEGLEELGCLKELHIEGQKLDLGEKLLFDPLSLRAISNTLSTLNISSNNIDNIREIPILTNLCTLYARRNIMSDLLETVNFVFQMTSLSNLDLRNNPVCSCLHYRENLISHGSLRKLDNKEIPEITRVYLNRLQAIRESRRHTTIPRVRPIPKRDESRSVVSPYHALHPSYRVYGVDAHKQTCNDSK